MNFLGKFFLYLGSFFLMILVFIGFLDKNKVFYTIQEELSKQAVLVLPEKIDSKAFGFTLKNSEVFYNGGLVVSSGSFDFSLVGFEILDVRPMNMLKNLFDFRIDKINYSLVDFANVYFVGDFGKGKVMLDVQRLKAIVEIEPSEKFRNSNNARYFKKSNGKMQYEFNLQ